MSANLQVFLAMTAYMLIVIGIGIYFARRANKSTENFFLGGRSLGPWVAAMSAEASDMSGWLLMGLPGLAYWCGIADAAWTAIGLAVGTYVNWRIVAKRLRQYSTVSGNAVTIPEFFSNRFHEKKKLLMGIAAVFIFVFFTVYAASCFVTCGKLFSGLFGFSYHSMMLVGAVFVVIYTFLGGFLAESVSDTMQAFVMIISLSVVLIMGTINVGGIGAVIDNVKNIPGYLSLTSLASPVTDAAGVQQVVNGAPVFGAASGYGFLTILSTLSWGLGYFGVPQVLLRFMAIRKASVLDMNFMNRIRDYISDGKISTAVNLCKKTDTPIARMIEKGIERIGRPMSDVQTAIENVANLEVSKLENGLPFLATIAGGAPMIGFLGTVLGMVQTFMDMSAAGGTVDLGLLSSGMYVAMVTTVMGLIVGIPAYFGYNYLVARIEKLVFQMEANSIAFMDILNQPVQK